jgi:hypothetical protein
MLECENCGARLEIKTRRDMTLSKRRRFPSHPNGGCHKYINDKLKNRCDLLDQDFRTPRMCKEDCGSQIYSFEIKIGSTPSKIYFDTPGSPWIKHDCNTKQNPVEQTAEYKPCVIEKYVSINKTLGSVKERSLGFVIQIQKDGFRQKTLIRIQNGEDNKQFVRQLHQPFFYKEVAPHIWILNTYQENSDANGELLSAPKNYICEKIDRKSLKGWKDVFGDENQLPLIFDYDQTLMLDTSPDAG